MKHISSIPLISLIFSSLVAISCINKVIALESPYLNEDFNANYEWANIPLVTPATVTIPVSNGGGGLDPNGVRTIYQTVGQYRTDFSDPSPSDSIRWSVEDVPPNIEMTGYFMGEDSNTIDMKLHGGFHNRPDDREGACTYIITIPLEGGDTYLRTECPHPVYKDCTSRSGAAEADSLGNEQWRGYKAIIWNKANGGVHLEAWEDQGNNDGATPANQWVRLFSYDHNPGETCGVFSEPLLQPRSPNNNQTTFRIDDNENTQAKWLSIVEIQPGGTASTIAGTGRGTR